jgi:hypothetical protein
MNRASYFVPSSVIAGLEPAIQKSINGTMDCRVKPGNDKQKPQEHILFATPDMCGLILRPR